MDVRTRNFLYLFSFSLLLFLPGLGVRDLWAPVEPRYAEIVRVMFTNGEWVVPTVNGALYTDKPILYFWIALAASHLFGGVSEWTVRLPAALGGVGFVLATYWLGRELFSPRIGAIAAMVLATCHRVIWESRWAHVDTLFGAFFLLTIYFGVRTLLGRARPREVLPMYVFMGLAVLTKGLIGIVLPGLLFAAFVIVRRDWSLIGAAKPLVGLAVLLVVLAPWLLAVSWASDGRWLTEFIYVHHFQRYIAGSGHRQPFFYYFKTLPADFLPWTTFLIPASFAYRDYRCVWREPHLLFCLLWFLTIFLFFSASDTKRDLYLLPLLPTLAFFVAGYLDDLDHGRIAPSKFYLWFAALSFCAVAISGIAFPLVAWFVQPDAAWPVAPTSLVLALGGSLAALLILRRQAIRAAVVVSVMMTFGILTMSFWTFPYLERFKSDRRFALEISRIVPATAPLYVYEDHMNDFNYYARRAVISVLYSPDEVEELRARHQTSYFLVKERDLGELAGMSRESIVASHTRGNITWHLIVFNNPR